MKKAQCVGCTYLVAEYQRQKVRANTRIKMRQYQAAGRAMGGKPPYGYHRNGKRLEPDTYEQETLERIKEFAARGFGQRKICAELTREGRRPRGSQWYPAFVRRVLRRLEDQIQK